MAILGFDLGGTKLAAALLSEEGKKIHSLTVPIGNRIGPDVGALICEQYRTLLGYAGSRGDDIKAVGISVPGISMAHKGTVWAPNIEGWANYPLYNEVQSVNGEIPVTIDSDRACYILGETWKGNAQGYLNVVFLAIGTGIGAGILIDGKILRGSNDIAGCVGWMALNQDFQDDYRNFGCFEYHASGDGIGRISRKYLREDHDYKGSLVINEISRITSHEVFEAFRTGDKIAARVINECICYWGMATANLISLFNPEKIIFGGGVFGPATMLIPEITREAEKWAQPLGMGQVSIEASCLGGEAGVFGAGYLALNSLSIKRNV